jgi:hypothetical protein
MMNIKLFMVAFALTAAMLASCKKEVEGYVGEYPDKAKVVFINAAPNNATVAADAQREIAIYPYYNGINYNNFPIKYPFTNGYKVFDPGTLTVRFDTARSQANNPPGPQATVGTYNLTVEANSYYSLYAVGSPRNVDTFFVKDNIDFPTAGKTKIMFLNLSPDAGPIDIVNSTTGQVLASNITYKQRRGYVEVEPSNAFNMQINVAGASTRLNPNRPAMVISANSVYTVWATGFRTMPSPGNTPGNYVLQLNYHANRWTDPNR